VSIEENKVVCHRLVEEFNQGNLDTAAKFLAADYIDHADPPGTPPGSGSAKQRWIMLRTAFPDAHVTLEDMIAEGDKVAARFTLHGTHNGELMGIPPTGKQVVVTGIDINRITNGKIVERWANFDTLGMLQQFGVIPAPKQAGA
jgi:steroid delta-isomerase-like uncharacterized protein